MNLEQVAWSRMAASPLIRARWFRNAKLFIVVFLLEGLYRL